MTQPPPYQGGYPPQQNPYGSGGQPPPSGTPGGFPQAGGPPPPSGFPPAAGGPGGPPPPPSNKGKIGGIIGGIALVLVIGVGYIGFKYFVREGVDQVADEAQGKTDVADVGDCTTKSANTNSTDASDVVTVACDSNKAFFEVVKREDNPKGTDGEKAGEEICTGTTAADYIYLEKTSGSIDWVICLDPIDIETAKFGEVPGQPGQCFSDNKEYFEIVDCGASNATIEVLTAEDNPDQSLTDGQAAFDAICDPSSTLYFTSESANNDVGPYDWFLCAVEVGDGQLAG